MLAAQMLSFGAWRVIETKDALILRVGIEGIEVIVGKLCRTASFDCVDIFVADQTSSHRIPLRRWYVD